jgi:hypothetical protein
VLIIIYVLVFGRKEYLFEYRALRYQASIHKPFAEMELATHNERQRNYSPLSHYDFDLGQVVI